MKISTYKDALGFLESFIGRIVFKVDLYSIRHDPLERMRILLSLLGNPQDKFKSVLVGGTSGKGSTSYLISHILSTAGYRVGLTISPHLQKVNERIQLNEKQISDEKFVQNINSILPSIRKMSEMSIGEPSYFEILIAMAFLYFYKQEVDIAVVEVGMGGEFDATNTLYPLVAVLTNVSLDHTEMLGKTVEEIAKTKSGIIKNYELRSKDQGPSMIQPIVVSGVTQPSVIKIVESRCKQTGAPLNLLGKDFGYKIKKESILGSVFDLTITRDRVQSLNDLRLSLRGDYQIENASLAIEAVRQLTNLGFKVYENDIKKALSTAFFPGRFEIKELKINLPANTLHRQLQTRNLKSKIILDGAHNPVKMKKFLKSLKKIFPTQRKIFIIAFKKDKDVKEILKEIIPNADSIIVTEFKVKTDMSLHAAMPSGSIKSRILSIKKNAKVYIEKDSKKALNKALSLLTIEQFNNQTIIVVTGSLYLVGEVRNML